MQSDPAAWLSEPFAHELGMMIARVVEKDMDQPQGNRVKELGRDEACKEIIVPAGGFALEALRVLAGHFTDQIVGHVL